ncbi:toll/interleukin-1 receptor domain-containing protein [Nostoc sp. ChiQUE01b]|uniref:toll/interleukin-1 receptor domain-containing protein n=1 Tax=Nostoc sp. ChiQUE01b TaxID=3075376 RepID=UPI002AD57AD3|nr:toll/interleukin-1 receptor domain-containing protein [Nostoc sp. ChiQUE01b]MDZ8257346.1 toll/interleukin-1 receptor domain-containing protein [Nostoc sp. ChiQUE01b]
MTQATVFISHISEEAELAAILKKHIESDFLRIVEVFVSSDTACIIAGENWLNSIRHALHNACAELVLCSRASVKRPWINFEAGASWMKGIPTVPLCHSGLRPRDLSMPFHVLQSVEANQVDGLARIYTVIARQLQIAPPRADFNRVVEEVRLFESAYIARLQETVKAESFKETGAWTRMKEALKSGNAAWRDVEKIAFIGGVTEGEALELLRNDPDIEFGKGKSGNRIVKLRSR